ncbi:anionic trypsin-like [Patiria miniata]|uniref:Peptidase S1 domain-containing protein n=1 Tax=Patiria miniata TaxID=46514 RepID=A0A914BII7_PATMI|nr:anionic trypsin-like [Patiria miniata]
MNRLLLVFFAVAITAVPVSGSRLAPRIVGGTKVTEGTRPSYIVYVGLGYSDLRDVDGTQVIKSKRVINHPDFDFFTNWNDIALIELPEEVELTDKIQTIPINRYDVAPGTKLMISGWGAISSNPEVYPYRMRQAIVDAFDRETCKNIYLGILKDITEDMICAQAEEGGKDKCLADSGGPIVSHFDQAGGEVLQGLISWGHGCDSEYPSVYTRVGSYCDWFAQVTKGDVTCQ